MGQKKIDWNEGEGLEDIAREFKILVNNLIPTTPDQAEWICNEIERLLRDHPELRARLDEWCRQDDDSRLLNQLAQAIKGRKEQRKTL